jgi:beta-mannanase
VPLITWESRSVSGAVTGGDDPAYSLPVILSGRYDDYLRRWARGVRDLGLPLIMRFDHEMNAPWYPWCEVNVSAGTGVNGNGRGDYVKVWRHVHDLFAQEGANDLVIWLWSPNRVDRIPAQPPPAAFYPGDDYVDWIGMSGYYRQYGEVPTFDQTFGRTLSLLRLAAAKPILLTEIGATEIGGNKRAWISDLFRGLAREDDVIGFVWFNLAVTSSFDGELVTNDWRIDSSRASIEAMRDGLALSGLGRPLVPG